MKKRILIVTLILLLIAGGLLTLFLLRQPEPETDTPSVLDKGAVTDFTDLFRLTDKRAGALVQVKIEKIEEVEDIVEKYELTDTLYTRITATVLRDFTERIKEKTLTVMLLGNSKNFPTREQLVVGNEYILRLEPWVNEKGKIHLISPLETTYLRVHEGKILSRESSTTPDYRPAGTPDEFADKLAAYRAENPLDAENEKTVLTAILQTLQGYDYSQKELAVTLSKDVIAARQKNAAALVSE